MPFPLTLPLPLPKVSLSVTAKSTNGTEKLVNQPPGQANVSKEKGKEEVKSTPTLISQSQPIRFAYPWTLPMGNVGFNGWTCYPTNSQQTYPFQLIPPPPIAAPGPALVSEIEVLKPVSAVSLQKSKSSTKQESLIVRPTLLAPATPTGQEVKAIEPPITSPLLATIPAPSSKPASITSASSATLINPSTHSFSIPVPQATNLINAATPTFLPTIVRTTTIHFIQDIALWDTDVATSNTKWGFKILKVPIYCSFKDFLDAVLPRWEKKDVGNNNTKKIEEGNVIVTEVIELGNGLWAKVCWSFSFTVLPG